MQNHHEQLAIALAAMPQMPTSEYRITFFQDTIIIEPINSATEARDLARRCQDLQDALPPAHRLETLADWFDIHDAQQVSRTGTEVQDDLRAWAKKIREVME